MPDSNNTIDLEGLDNLPDVPSVYYGAASGLVGKIDPLAGSLMAKATLPGGTTIAMTINLIKDPDNPGKVIASTVLASGITYVLGNALAATAIPELIVGAVALATGVVATPATITIAATVGVAVVATIAGSYLYDLIYNGLSGLEELSEIDIYSPEIVGKVTLQEFILQSVANDPDFCKRIFPEYVNYRQITEIKSGTESFLYNQLTQHAKVQTASTTEAQAVQTILQNTQVQTINLNNKNIKVADLTNLELRNAIDGIDQVSFLLSNIILYVGEKLDLGSHGIYEVKSEDTLSMIAQNLNDGTVTKDLVKLNPWLDGKYFRFEGEVA